MSFLNTARAALDDDFRLRITACLYKLAGDVLNESADAPDHETRANLAYAIRLDGIIPVDRFAWLCASNPAISGSVGIVDGQVTVGAPDGDIEYVCASSWNDVAAQIVRI